MRASPHRDEAVAVGRASLVLLTPHLRRAFRLDQQLRAAQTQAALAQSLLDALPQAVLAADATGRVCHANRAAEALVADGAALRQRRCRLVAASTAQTAALRAALRRALEAPLGRSPGLAPSLVLHDPSGATLGLTIIPLDRYAGPPERPARGLALLIATPMQTSPSVPAMPSTAFGFTGAEAELAIALVGGQRVDSVTATRGVRAPGMRL